jgi:hypothetical protein
MTQVIEAVGSMQEVLSSIPSPSKTKTQQK